MRQIIISLFLVLLLPVSLVFAAFPDVDYSTDYPQSINWMAQNGVVNGYEDGRFGPNDCVTRVQFLKMLYGALQVDVDDYTAVLFPDTFYDEWYQAYVKAARVRGTADGYPDGTFKPHKCVNRVEAAKMAVLEFNDGVVPSYRADFGDVLDIDLNAWYGDIINYALSSDSFGMNHRKILYSNQYPAIVLGFNFDPAGEMSRAEVAELLFRMKTMRDHNLNAFDANYGPIPINYPFVIEPIFKDQFSYNSDNKRKDAQLVECVVRDVYGFWTDISDCPSRQSTIGSSDYAAMEAEMMSIVGNIALSPYLGVADSSDLKVIKREDKLGSRFLTFDNEVFEGMEVVGTGMILNANPFGFGGVQHHWYDRISVPLTPLVADWDAETRILNSVLTHTHSDGNTEEFVVENSDDNGDLKLVVFPNRTSKGIEMRLAWEIPVDYHEQCNGGSCFGYSNWTIYLDAINGEALKSQYNGSTAVY